MAELLPFLMIFLSITSKKMSGEGSLVQTAPFLVADMPGAEVVIRQVSTSSGVRFTDLPISYALWLIESLLGEFSSPKQGTFYHYNDFWKLDPSNREWERIETKGKGPPARSGHRMTYHKV